MRRNQAAILGWHRVRTLSLHVLLSTVLKSTCLNGIGTGLKMDKFTFSDSCGCVGTLNV